MAERDPVELHDMQPAEQVSVPDAEKQAAKVRKKRRLKVLLALTALKVVTGAGA